MSLKISDLRWNLKRRLEFIEFRLFWDGRINRSDLIDFFNISTPQASSDFARYMEFAPGNFSYDAREKSYLVTEAFKPVFYEPNSQRYFVQLLMLSNSLISRDETWSSWIPEFRTIPSISRMVDPLKLKRIQQTIKNKESIYVQYQSLSREQPLWRWLSPHALAYDGTRWHVRAFCHRNESYRDFVFARMLQLGENAKGEGNSNNDIEWIENVTFKLGPNPNLPSEAKKAIEIDYEMIDGELSITTNVALSFYLERRLNLDLDSNSLSPQRQQIVLLNRNEVESIRNEVKEKVNIKE